MTNKRITFSKGYVYDGASILRADWKTYEAEKKRISETSPEEYERRLKELTERLKI